MRAFVLGILLAASCGGPVSPADATPGSVVGAWAVTWTCVDGCQYDGVAPLRFDDRLDVTQVADGDDAAWSSTTCADCAATDHGSDDDSCLHVAAGDHAGVAHESYTLCAAGGQISGDVTWSGYPGFPAPRTWHAIGNPR